jgi:uncharacterized protein YgiM (DUF1202 family)
MVYNNLMPETSEQVIYAYVNPDALNIRSGPSTTGTIIGQLSKDQRVEVISNLGQWWKVKSAEAEGFVVADYLRLAETRPSGDLEPDQYEIYRQIFLSKE